jgi:hypothetical protein
MHFYGSRVLCLVEFPHNLDYVPKLLFLLGGVEYQRLRRGFTNGSRLHGAQFRFCLGTSAGNNIDAGIRMADQVGSKKDACLRIGHVLSLATPILCLPFLNQLETVLNVMFGLSAVTASRLTRLWAVACNMAQVIAIVTPQRRTVSIVPRHLVILPLILTSIPAPH